MMTFPADLPAEFDSDGLNFRYYPDFFSGAKDRYAQIMANTNWEYPSLRVFGKHHRLRRGVVWYGTSDYSYSGHTHPARAMPEAICRINDLIQKTTGCRFNSVLMNLYPDGGTGMGWHSDNEPGVADTIASVSLGAPRHLDFRKTGQTTRKLRIVLGDGSLLLMLPPTQATHQHSVPVTRKVTNSRINLTFRILT